MQEFISPRENGSADEFPDFHGEYYGRKDDFRGRSEPDEEFFGENAVGIDKEFPDNNHGKGNAEKEGQDGSLHEKLKKLKKMVYMVSASVAAVTVINSAAESQTVETGQEKYGFIDISGYASVGAYDGGVLSVQFSEKSWGLATSDGSVILREDVENVLLGNPNDSGCAVFRNEEGIYVTDASGNKILDIPEYPVFARVTEDVLFTITEEGGLRNYKYRDLHGELIYESGAHTTPELGAYHRYAGDFFVGATPFIDGHAFCYDGEGIVRVERNGDTERLVSWTGLSEEDWGWYSLNEAPVMMVAGFSDDYILGRYINRPLDIALVNLDTKEAWANYNNLYDKLLSDTQYRYSGIVGEPWSNTYAEIDGYSYPFSGYYADGAEIFSNGPYVVRKFRLTGSDREFFTMLTDYTKEDYYNEILGAVCYHDEIYPSAYGIYLAADDGEYFYMNQKGERISGQSYAQASAFTSNGYALVLEEGADKAYLIDKNLERIDEFPGITEIEPECRGNGIIVVKDEKRQMLAIRD